MSLINDIFDQYLNKKGNNNFIKQYKKAYHLLNDQEVKLYKGGFKEGYLLALSTKADVVERMSNPKKIIGHQLGNPPKSVIDELLNKVCLKYELSKKDLVGKQRTKDFVRARNIIHNILAEKYKMSLTDIGRIFGQDHTTVLYSIQMKYNGERYWGQDQTMWQEFDELIKS